MEQILAREVFVYYPSVKYSQSSMGFLTNMGSVNHGMLFHINNVQNLEPGKRKQQLQQSSEGILPSSYLYFIYDRFTI